MKPTTSILALLLPAISARFVQETDGDHVQLHPEVAEAEKFHIELAPGETRWVTEEEKWELRRVCLIGLDKTTSTSAELTCYFRVLERTAFL